jgi:hypothetical protein
LLMQGCSGGGSGGGNKPPKIDAFSPPEQAVTVAVGGEVNFSITASDPDGDTLGYSWSKTGEGILTAGNSKTATWKAPEEAGTATVKVVVTDGKGGVVSHTWSITIGTVKPPIITNATPVSSPTTPVEVNLNEERVLSINTSDPGGRPLTSTWICSKGVVKDQQLNTAKWVAPAATGPATVTVTVSNGVVSTKHTWHFNVKGNVVYVTDDITIPTTWASGNIYVIDNLHDINVESTLTIQPGTIIKFGQGKGLYTSGNGRIEAVGTSTLPIVFTSLRDDLQGGDTNKDQNTTTPDSGDWNEVYLGTKNGNKFEHCEFYYGGGGISEIMLDLAESVGTPVKNCTFAFSEGIALSAVYVPSVSIEGNTFYNNEKPLAINVNVSIDDSNEFHNPLNSNEINTYQGIFADPDGGTYFTKTIVWGETEVAFVLQGWDFVIEEAAKLTLQPGTTVKFYHNTLTVNGLLEAKGAALKPIVFTSINDDRYGGQSNGASSHDPQAGDWDYIYVADNARATFDHCRISYGGTNADRQGGYAALCESEYSDSTVISNTTFEDNLRGLDLLSAQSSIEDSEFLHNRYPLRVGFDIDTDNTILFSNNTYNAIYVGGGVNRASRDSIEWLNTIVPYVLNEDAYLDGTVVHLGTGTIIRVWKDQEIDLQGGAALDNFAKAIFTSYRDVARGGDVGGGSVAPKKGDWVGIYDEEEWGYLSGPNIFYAENN